MDSNANMTTPAPTPAPRWLHVELMGHTEITGRVTEVEEFGKRWMRIDVLCTHGHLVACRTVNPTSAVYGYSERTEDEARNVGLAECQDPSHELWCSRCGFKRPAALPKRCAVCGGGESTVLKTPLDVRPLDLAQGSPSFLYDMVVRAGADVVCPTEGAYSDYNPGAYLRYGMPIPERLRIAHWAIAFHRARFETGVTVPPRPELLCDREGGPLVDAHDTDDEMPC